MKWKIFILSIIFLFSLSILPALDYTIPPNTYSIQSGDFDNDEDNDIVVGHTYQWGCISFLENIGNGEFVLTDTLRPYGSNLIHGIINLDDDITPDIVFDGQDNYSQLIFIIFNNDLSSLFSYSLNISAPVHPLLFGDFDCDSDYDLVFSSSGAGLDNLWGLMYNLGDREFSEPEWFECPSQAGNAGFYQLECHDLDNNCFDDIIAYTNMETYIYYGDGNFFELDSLNCYAPNGGMVSEDFDNDEDYDIIVTHWPGGTQSHFLIYENIGESEFTLHDVIYNNLWGQPISVDINGDGLDDIVNVGNINGIGIFYNIGNMQFDEAVYEPVESYGENYFRASFSDFDGNGTQDVAIIRYGIEENNLTVLYNDGTGNFLEEPQVGISNFEYQISNVKLKNYPNPFNPLTTISYDLPVNISNPVIEIFNIKGEKVREFPIITPSPAHSLSVTWDGTDNYRKPVSSGVYFYRIKSDEGVLMSKKMLLLR